jgi:hypothetical protein
MAAANNPAFTPSTTTGAFLDNLFYSPAENAPVFIGQVLCRQHDYRNVPPVSVGMNDRLPLLFRRSDNNL